MKRTILFIPMLLSIIFCHAQTNETIKLSAIEDFNSTTDSNYIPYYQDTQREALAINAAQYKNQFALAVSRFEGESGKYLVSILTMAENDGESTYKLLVNDKVIATAQNPTTTKSFEDAQLDFGRVKLKTSDKIAIAFNSHTNEKIPEGDITAYSRGRWKALILAKK
ncbi:hypothetical protein [Reichenbachiella ulvae]|uniref:Uncharacterized protein n=1 Tax=Reichenbachiella ulvae TaxID=2980104 RepID=A0ABT3CSX2_9BACT|nr:hypothetical protein [Reichenbachiella ulvae]MCV9386707.1 hypothetical protein [Reichenbachiella ulvae]